MQNALKLVSRGFASVSALMKGGMGAKRSDMGNPSLPRSVPVPFLESSFGAIEMVLLTQRCTNRSLDPALLSPVQEAAHEDESNNMPCKYLNDHILRVNDKLGTSTVCRACVCFRVLNVREGWKCCARRADDVALKSAIF